MKPEYLVFGMVIADIIIGLAYGLKSELWRAGYWLAAAYLSYSTTRF
jgi:hypothetical protein